MRMVERKRGREEKRKRKDNEGRKGQERNGEIITIICVRLPSSSPQSNAIIVPIVGILSSKAIFLLL